MGRGWGEELIGQVRESQTLPNSNLPHSRVCSSEASSQPILHPAPCTAALWPPPQAPASRVDTSWELSPTVGHLFLGLGGHLSLAVSSAHSFSWSSLWVRTRPAGNVDIQVCRAGCNQFDSAPAWPGSSPSWALESVASEHRAAQPGLQGPT
jgi:hypothetical protein